MVLESPVVRSPTLLPRPPLRSAWQEAVISLVGRTVEEVERELILTTLAHQCGNRTCAAHVLGISVRSLRDKIRQYSALGLPVPSATSRPTQLRLFRMTAGLDQSQT
jgi:two-component system response regulator FlrC